MRWVRWRRGAWLRSIARRRSARLRSVDWSLWGISTSLRVASWRVARGLLVLARLHDHSMPWLHRNAGLSLRCGVGGCGVGLLDNCNVLWWRTVLVATFCSSARTHAAADAADNASDYAEHHEHDDRDSPAGKTVLFAIVIGVERAHADAEPVAAAATRTLAVLAAAPEEVELVVSIVAIAGQSARRLR